MKKVSKRLIEKLKTKKLKENNLDEICFTNWMLCAAKYVNPEGKLQNAYNKKSIETCFSNVSSKVLSILSPDIIIFSGGVSIDAAVKEPISLTKRRNNIYKTLHYSSK